MPELESCRGELSEDVWLGLGTLLVVEQSSLDNRLRGGVIIVIYAVVCGTVLRNLDILGRLSYQGLRYYQMCHIHVCRSRAGLFRVRLFCVNSPPVQLSIGM